MHAAGATSGERHVDRRVRGTRRRRRLHDHERAQTSRSRAGHARARVRPLQRWAAGRRVLGIQQHERARRDDPESATGTSSRRANANAKPADESSSGAARSVRSTTHFDASAGNLVWTLSGKTATGLGQGSKACNPTIELRKVTVPADDPGVFQLRINNTVVATGGNGTTSGQLRIGHRRGHRERDGRARHEPRRLRLEGRVHANGTVDVSVAGHEGRRHGGAGRHRRLHLHEHAQGQRRRNRRRRRPTHAARRRPAAGAADAARPSSAARPRRDKVGRARRSSPSEGG